MSWTTICSLPDEPVDAVVTESYVQVTIGNMPDEIRLMLPRPLAARLHSALGDALAAAGEGARDE